MPPSNFGARPSMATQWHCVGSPIASAPASSSRLQHFALVVRRAANDEVVRGLAPGFLQPFEIRFEAAGGAIKHLPPNFAGSAVRAAACRRESARPRDRGPTTSAL